MEEQLSLPDSVPDIVAFDFTDGIDGSGQQADYEQKSKKGYSTSTIIFSAFSLAKIFYPYSSQITWKNPARNRPSIHPLALFPSKEHQEINIISFKDLATEVSLRILVAFPEAIISPSLHRLLAHGWKRIEANKNFGLGSSSEEGLEAQNKFIQQQREHGARKTSTENNFKDVWRHLWRNSSLVLGEMDREKTRGNK